ncbi:hypothetical protein BgAZ_300480 [Babesia gibsoni]|uniref:Uncharacterized protein n=1 Tax=Babesia gibsoni TaxID=33632 RepID=A0AAD8P8G5_BABGI|nr:hypothetical protein BgAZ_300480 [Babesia gibsoni]
MIPLSIAAFAVYTQLVAPLTEGLTHRKHSTLCGEILPIDPHDDSKVALVIPLPSQHGHKTHLPTNEENALLPDDFDYHADEEDLKDLEELMKHPVPEKSIEAEREELQAAGELPEKEPFKVIPKKGSKEEKYSNGVSDTAKIFDDASSTVEDDGKVDEHGENERLAKELRESMEALDSLKPEH